MGAGIGTGRRGAGTSPHQQTIDRSETHLYFILLLLPHDRSANILSCTTSKKKRGKRKMDGNNRGQLLIPINCPCVAGCQLLHIAGDVNSRHNAPQAADNQTAPSLCHRNTHRARGSLCKFNGISHQRPAPLASTACCLPHIARGGERVTATHRLPNSSTVAHCMDPHTNQRGSAAN